MATFNGTAGNDNLVGTADVDTINGLAGNDIIEGLGGLISAGGGPPEGDKLFGGAGIDILSYWSSAFGVEVTLGASGAIVLAGFGHASGDTGDGFESLLGSAHEDILTGNGSDNVIEGGAGADEMHGGLGNDTLSYSRAPVGVFVKLKAGAIDFASDLIFDGGGGGAVALNGSNSGHAEGDEGDGFENLNGSAFNDQIIGDAFTNVIKGGAGRDDLRGGDGVDLGGNDQLFGEDGDDVLTAGLGIEYFDGGAGRDVLAFAGSPGGVSVTLGKKGSETVGVGSYAQSDRIANIEDLSGSDFSDIFKGNEKKNTLTGWGGNDTLKGGSGKDNLGGVGGDDVLNGGSGNDRIFGGAGMDIMKGGAGKDRFYFTEELGPGNVGTIRDFDPGKDVIEFRQSVFYTLSAGKLKANAFEKGKRADDVKDRIIHNPKNGDVFFDVDGKGGEEQVLFARVKEGLKLIADDFFVA